MENNLAVNYCLSDNKRISNEIFQSCFIRRICVNKIHVTSGIYAESIFQCNIYDLKWKQMAIIADCEMWDLASEWEKKWPLRISYIRTFNLTTFNLHEIVERWEEEKKRELSSTKMDTFI